MSQTTYTFRLPITYTLHITCSSEEVALAVEHRAYPKECTIMTLDGNRHQTRHLESARIGSDTSSKGSVYAKVEAFVIFNVI